MLKLSIITVCYFLSSPLWAGSQALPPIGKRAYVITKGFAPAKIQSKKPTQGLYLKDPVQPTAKMLAEPLASRHKRATIRRTNKKSSKINKVKFSTMRVAGHLSKPRTDFKGEILAIERADEPIRSDFYPRVFAPLTDPSF